MPVWCDRLNVCEGEKARMSWDLGNFELGLVIESLDCAVCFLVVSSSF